MASLPTSSLALAKKRGGRAGGGGVVWKFRTPVTRQRKDSVNLGRNLFFVITDYFWLVLYLKKAGPFKLR